LPSLAGRPYAGLLDPVSGQQYFAINGDAAFLPHYQNFKGTLYEGHCESVDLCAAYYENRFYF